MARIERPNSENVGAVDAVDIFASRLQPIKWYDSGDVEATDAVKRITSPQQPTDRPDSENVGAIDAVENFMGC